MLPSCPTAALVSLWPVSSAHCCVALSIWRRLLMQAFDWEVLRALTKLGIAIAARRPMMATTIMISTSVKPALREVLIFICFLTFSVTVCGVNTSNRRVNYHYGWCSLIACCNRTSRIAAEVPTGFRFRHSRIRFRRQAVLVGGAKGTEKARSVASGLANQGGLNLLLQHMRGITACVRTCDAWGGIHIWANCIGCVAGRASRHHVAFDVLLNFGLDNRVEVLLALLECPLLDRTVYLSHVADTRVRLRRVAGLDEVGNRNRR